MLIVEPFSFDAAYPRRSLRATQQATDVLKCLGKKYSLAGGSATGNGINVVLAHANGFQKELYEPFIDFLLSKSAVVQAVFIHDVVTQGYSGRLNEGKLGDEYHWSDSGMDVIAMIAHCRAAGLMDRAAPIMGIGHSMGGCQLAYAAEIHHGLFAALVLMDAIIMPTNDRAGLAIASLSMNRRTTWPSREDARTRMSKSNFYKAWHPAVFDKWMEHALTLTGHKQEVTLTTTVAQEVYAFLHYRPLLGQDSSNKNTSQYVFDHLPFITSPVHFIFGETSNSLSPAVRTQLLTKVQQGTRVDVKGAGHLIPMEMPEECAALCAQYAKEALARHARLLVEAGKTPRQVVLTDEYKAVIKSSLANLLDKAKL